jgi:hypothetical protein
LKTLFDDGPGSSPEDEDVPSFYPKNAGRLTAASLSINDMPEHPRQGILDREKQQTRQNKATVVVEYRKNYRKELDVILAKWCQEVIVINTADYEEFEVEYDDATISPDGKVPNQLRSSLMPAACLHQVKTTGVGRCAPTTQE